jgi:hypothetical protein
VVDLPHHGRRGLQARVCARLARVSGAASRLAELDQQPCDGRAPRRHARRAPGAVTVGKDIIEAFVLANYMEENAYRQYMALQIGKPYSFNEEELALCREKLWNANLFKRTWDHFRAKLR